jgi:hypothetical protein
MVNVCDIMIMITLAMLSLGSTLNLLIKQISLKLETKDLLLVAVYQ